MDSDSELETVIGSDSIAIKVYEYTELSEALDRVCQFGILNTLRLFVCILRFFSHTEQTLDLFPSRREKIFLSSLAKKLASLESKVAATKEKNGVQIRLTCQCPYLRP